MKSLYRRYRPTKLADVVGQPQVTEPLVKSLKQHKISHAYLFIGPRGCGKTSVARILAHEINEFKYEIEDDYIDIIEIDGASNRGIDNIRELREKAAIAPTSGKYKVYIIDEVHMLTKEAFNALLKTLEEPPAHVVFIMATTDAYKVPVTITSRAQTYTFKLADHKTMFDFLKSVISKEKIKIADDAVDVIIKRGGGSFRDTLSLLDQISSISEETITKELILKALGLPEDELIDKLLLAYLTQDINSIRENLKNLLNSGIKAETIAEELINTIINDPKPELMPLLSSLPDAKAPYAEAKILVALIRPLPRAISSHVANPTINPINLPSNKPVVSKPINSATKDVSQKTVPAAQAPKPIEQTAPSASFEWQSYLDKIQSLSDAVYSQLIKTEHNFDGTTLHIYPMKRIVKTILTRENNKKILFNAIENNVKITIHEISDSPISQTNDETITKISDIMGGEVISDGGTSPF
ncbi:DNA polymerase III subunit gamma/tau [Candidatus Saccharibacteria bacterium]|nr:DNA polymerase III subunit gamma/tau [Candidatus Saccharibacteria bacterium]